MKLGLKPFTPSLKDFHFSSYRTDEPLPKHPAQFGHEELINQWGILANDRVGCCVLAGAAHETMLWLAMGGAPTPLLFNEETVLADYSAITGYNPDDPNSDQGTDIREAADYRLKTGIVDVNGNRHKIGAYVFIQTIDEMMEAIYLFGAVGYGFQVPSSAMQQFEDNKPWSLVRGSPTEGGHYICGVAERSMMNFVTWGRIQAATKPFIRSKMMAAVAYISEEALHDGKSLEGFALADLRNDLARL